MNLILSLIPAKSKPWLRRWNNAWVLPKYNTATSAALGPIGEYWPTSKFKSLWNKDFSVGAGEFVQLGLECTRLSDGKSELWLIILKSFVHKFHNFHHNWYYRSAHEVALLNWMLTYLLCSHGVIKSTRWFVANEALTPAQHKRGARILRIPAFIIRVSGGGRAPSTIFAECDGGGGRRWRTPQLRSFVMGRVDPHFPLVNAEWLVT